MKEYETLFISHPDQSPPQILELNDKLKAVIERNGGRLFLVKDMGKRSFAYPIAKQAKGLYTCLDYADNGQSIAEIERILRLDESVLRFLTTVRRREVDVEVRAAEIIARGEDQVEQSDPDKEKEEAL